MAQKKEKAIADKKKQEEKLAVLAVIKKDHPEIKIKRGLEKSFLDEVNSSTDLEDIQEIKDRTIKFAKDLACVLQYQIELQRIGKAPQLPFQLLKAEKAKIINAAIDLCNYDGLSCSMVSLGISVLKLYWLHSSFLANEITSNN